MVESLLKNRKEYNLDGKRAVKINTLLMYISIYQYKCVHIN